MQLRVLAESARVAHETFIEKAMATPAGFARLKAVFEGWIGWSRQAGLVDGCPVAGRHV